MTKPGHRLGRLFGLVDNPDEAWKKFGKEDAPFNLVANVLQKRPVFKPVMQGNAYSLDELLPYLAELGAEGVHVRPEATTAGQSCAFIFCGKPRGKTPLDSGVANLSIRLS